MFSIEVSSLIDSVSEVKQLLLKLSVLSDFKLLIDFGREDKLFLCKSKDWRDLSSKTHSGILFNC